MRRYVCLVEDVLVGSHWGDTAFVLLGFYDASSPTAAENAARREHGLVGHSAPVVVVPARYWGTSQ